MMPMRRRLADAEYYAALFMPRLLPDVSLPPFSA